MKTIEKCPCCSSQLLRHIRHNEVYWFCRHCWQEMPLLNLLHQDLPILPPFVLSPLN